MAHGIPTVPNRQACNVYGRIEGLRQIPISNADPITRLRPTHVVTSEVAVD
ncbi:MAG TPA: hypothetical protein VE673_12500 [Pseudonocardiaceae bacterium]|jgi:type II secretory pathway component PulK|nr:hypothetical protein [Pseudonocardiaceae bacterium]